MPSHVVRTKLSAVLEVAGKEYLCSHVTLNFALNSIPSASCVLAIGRDMRSLEPALIHSTADELTYLLPAKIYLEPSGAWSTDDSVETEGRWDEAGRQVIFDGYLTGRSLQKSRGQIQPSLHLIHWLSDMSFSSTISNQSHPGNPSRFRWKAIYGPRGVASQARSSFVWEHIKPFLFSSDAITKDFWTESLFQMFGDLAEGDALDTELFEDQCRGVSKQNFESQKALARFETSHTNQEVVGTNYRVGSSSSFFKKLPLLSGAIDVKIAEAIGSYCNAQELDSFFNSTMWDTLIGAFSAAFAFAVVPKVQTAMVVPYVPGYRTAFDQEFSNGKVLDIRDISTMESSALIQRPLRGVGVIQSGMGDTTGAFQRDAYTTLGGCFAPSDDARGMVIYKAPPPWLAQVPSHAHAGLGLALAPAPGCAMVPVAPAGTRALLAAAGAAGGPVAVVNNSKDYYVAAARYFYNQEVLRGRNAVVSGKLRFDLAPGTTVRLINAAPPFLPNDQLSQDMVASVTRVSISLSADPAGAGTTFQLDHVRTARENEGDATSTPDHPFYTETFSGTPLVDQYLFPESNVT